MMRSTQDIKKIAAFVNSHSGLVMLRYLLSPEEYQKEIQDTAADAKLRRLFDNLDSAIVADVHRHVIYDYGLDYPAKLFQSDYQNIAKENIRAFKKAYRAALFGKDFVYKKSLTAGGLLTGDATTLIAILSENPFLVSFVIDHTVDIEELSKQFNELSQRTKTRFLSSLEIEKNKKMQRNIEFIDSSMTSLDTMTFKDDETKTKFFSSLNADVNKLNIFQQPKYFQKNMELIIANMKIAFKIMDVTNVNTKIIIDNVLKRFSNFVDLKSVYNLVITNKELWDKIGQKILANPKNVDTAIFKSQIKLIIESKVELFLEDNAKSFTLHQKPNTPPQNKPQKVSRTSSTLFGDESTAIEKYLDDVKVSNEAKEVIRETLKKDLNVNKLLRILIETPNNGGIYKREFTNFITGILTACQNDNYKTVITDELYKNFKKHKSDSAIGQTVKDIKLTILSLKPRTPQISLMDILNRK